MVVVHEGGGGRGHPLLMFRQFPSGSALLSAGFGVEPAAIDAVLRSGLVTSLVTDTSAADYLMTAGPAPRPALNRADPDGP